MKRISSLVAELDFRHHVFQVGQIQLPNQLRNVRDKPGFYKKHKKCSGGLQTSIRGRDWGKKEWKAEAFRYIW